MKFFRSAPLPPPPKPPRRPPAPPLARGKFAARAALAKTHAPPAPLAAPGIVGVWREPRGNDTVEFKTDGTLIEQSAGGEKIHGHYSLAGTNLSVALEGVGELSFSVSLSHATLDLRDAEGQVTRYSRS